MLANKPEEIERKFLVNTEHPDFPNCNLIDEYFDITQGYAILTTPVKQKKKIQRLRQTLKISKTQGLLSEKYFLTTKGEGDVVREERECLLTKDQFQTHWPNYLEVTIHKHRYKIEKENNVIEIDFFRHYEIKNLVLAEVEFKTLEEANNYIPEPWMLEDVSKDPLYTNYHLAMSSSMSKIDLIQD